MGIIVKFRLFLPCPFTKYVLTLHLISGEVGKFPVEKLSTSEVISQKPRGGQHPPQVPLGLIDQYKNKFKTIHYTLSFSLQLVQRTKLIPRGRYCRKPLLF